MPPDGEAALASPVTPAAEPVSTATVGVSTETGVESPDSVVPGGVHLLPLSAARAASSIVRVVGG